VDACISSHPLLLCPTLTSVNPKDLRRCLTILFSVRFISVCIVLSLVGFGELLSHSHQAGGSLGGGYRTCQLDFSTSLVGYSSELLWKPSDPCFLLPFWLRVRVTLALASLALLGLGWSSFWSLPFFFFILFFLLGLLFYLHLDYIVYYITCQVFISTNIKPVCLV
jgi:hypothetical protein